MAARLPICGKVDSSYVPKCALSANGLNGSVMLSLFAGKKRRMSASTETVPTPVLRIIPVSQVYPHEVHDSQRSAPLREKLKHAETLVNPIIVAPMDSTHYVVLDGANRYHTLCDLGYPQIIAQVVNYSNVQVRLDVWQHVISHWERVLLIEQIDQLDGIQIEQGWQDHALARLTLRGGLTLSIISSSDDLEERNRQLRSVVNVYQTQARLFRTASIDPGEIWHLYPQAIALIAFPRYEPDDIIAAARTQALLPTGISRHIIFGRALKLNYPLKVLRDESISVDEKNEALRAWVEDRLSNRGVRFYAESTYLFDE